MRCPACSSALTQGVLESELAALECGGCGGQWVKGFQYWKWLEQHGANLPKRDPEPGAPSPESDSKPGKLCPECGRFLTRHKVGQGVPFHLDRCGNCGGLWFDRDEWQALKARNLHDDLHFIFSEAWQTQVRREERADYERRALVKNVGEDTVARLEQIKQWLDHHPKRTVLQAYLLRRAD